MTQIDRIRAKAHELLNPDLQPTGQPGKTPWTTRAMYCRTSYQELAK